MLRPITKRKGKEEGKEFRVKILTSKNAADLLCKDMLLFFLSQNETLFKAVKESNSFKWRQKQSDSTNVEKLLLNMTDITQ